LQAFQHRQSTEEGKGRNGEEGTSEKDKAIDGHRIEGADVGEVRKGRQVGHPGLEDCRCAGENSRDEVEDSRGQYNLLAEVQRRGNGDSEED